MEFDTSTWMMFFFILALTASMWKIYAFLPHKQLKDDDTTKESQEELLVIIKKYQKLNGRISNEELFQKVKDDVNFDKEHFWRFNQNKLNQLLLKIDS